MSERISVECSSTVKAEPGDDLIAGIVKQWLQNVPNGASITPITEERGTQRDPWPALVGLRAAWSETR